MEHIIYHIMMAAIGVLLFMAGVTDIRKRQIRRRTIGVLFLICIAAAAAQDDLGLWDVLSGAAVGACAVGLSVLSHERIGRGDGLIIGAIGMALGMRRCLMVVSVSLFMMCITAAIVLMLKKGDRDTKLPFVPAIFAGYALCMWI